MPSSPEQHSLKRLLIGLTDQEILKGNQFFYDGGALYADEVGSLMLPSVLCIAQDVASRVGMGSLGFGFELTAGGSSGDLPLAMRQQGEVAFVKVAAFVVEVFDNEMMECRNDMARLFETAAKLIDPSYDLASRSNHSELNM